MLSLFRNFFQSKIGLPIFIGFLVVVGVAFAMADVSGSFSLNGLTGDDKVVVIDGESVSAAELAAAANDGLDRARQQNPALTMAEFVEQGGLDSELDLMIDRYSASLFAQKYGLRAGDNLVNSEILKISAFRNLTGEFDQAAFQAALRQRGITEAVLRRDIADGLLNQQILRPAFAATRLPRAAARHYAALVLERRLGQIAMIPSRDYAPTGNPTSEQLSAFYRSNQSDFVVPERRTLRFAPFGAESITANLTPTAEQIAARYNENADQYAAQERRAITSFVVPTEAAAKALVARVRGGVSLEAAAQEADFNVSRGELRDREDLAAATSFALAEAAFAGEKGAILDPTRSQLGWYVARIDDVERTPARSLAQVREEISAQLANEARAAALVELSENIEAKVDGGASLTDVATEFGLEVTSVADITADGQLFGLPGQGVGPVVQPLISTAFQMEESQPQLAELVPGQQFLIFDVEEIVKSAAPPIAEVREEVIAAWRRSEGSKEARKAADRILAAVRGGKSLPQAMRDENPALNQLENIDLERRQLAANAERGIPTALVLMFSMAQGSTKLLEDQNDLGWFIVDLDKILAEPVADDNPVAISTRQQVAGALASEYNAQLIRAIREEMGVDRNEQAIEALRKTLRGES